MALVGNLRLWTVQELVSSVLLCNHKSIQGETVRKVCENFQYLDMGIFVHILSGRKRIMDKPISIKIEETKKSIADTLNESQLHPYIMDSIMRELYEEVHSLYIRTVQAENDEYKKSLESNNTETTEE